ncbi:MAG: hypothetical protein PHV34_13805 [Verrucomicrobiae bacterium]|nr:hypothetical protein [Verrucomicrobiae bacterium]
MSSRLPFPYHWVPGVWRVWLAKRLFRPHVRGVRSQPNRSPRTYADGEVDRILDDGFSTADQEGWSWPDKKSCALILSHDTDSVGQERGIELLCQLAKRKGLRSCFSFVGKDLQSYRPLIRDLVKEGFEVALHDIAHDNLIAFLSEDEIIARLRPVMDLARELGMKGFRSPSWYVSPAFWAALEKTGFSYDMSALDSWPFFHPSQNYGVRTFRPFMVGGLVVLPNTIPFEMPWLADIPLSQTFPFWRPKLDLICQEGGLVMFNAHPDQWYCGNSKAVAELERCLDHVLETHHPATLMPHQLSQYVRETFGRGACVDLGGAPPVRAPRCSEKPSRKMGNGANPFIQLGDERR